MMRSQHPRKQSYTSPGNGGNIRACIASMVVVEPISSKKMQGPCVAACCKRCAGQCLSQPASSDLQAQASLVEIAELGKAVQTVSKRGKTWCCWVSACDTRRL